tara:strand:- start:408 stop:575 length:168 start_codon:yes stop_codon:yes gene_type:complete
MLTHFVLVVLTVVGDNLDLVLTGIQDAHHMFRDVDYVITVLKVVMDLWVNIGELE